MLYNLRGFRPISQCISIPGAYCIKIKRKGQAENLPDKIPPRVKAMAEEGNSD